MDQFWGMLWVGPYSSHDHASGAAHVFSRSGWRGGRVQWVRAKQITGVPAGYWVVFNVQRDVLALAAALELAPFEAARP